VGLGGLSRLSIRFIKLGIKPERIELGRPERNSQHEWMYHSLKETAANPPKGLLKGNGKPLADLRQITIEFKSDSKWIKYENG